MVGILTKTNFNYVINFIKIIQTSVIMHVFYFGIVTFFVFIELFDPLDKKLAAKKTFFKDKNPCDEALDDFYHPF